MLVSAPCVTRARIGLVTIGLVLIALSASAQPSPPDDGLDANINGAAGSWSVGDGGFHVFGTGTDIWGTANQFHFTYEQMDGDGEFHARVTDVDGRVRRHRHTSYNTADAGGASFDDMRITN